MHGCRFAISSADSIPVGASFLTHGTEWMVPAVPPVMVRRVALVVLGVGRSGTSALTRVANLLGAALPADVLGPGVGNEHGHFEPARLIALHDDILRLHSLSWWSLTPVPSTWYATLEAEAFVRRAMAIITEDYGAASLIVIKEPRLCLVAPVLFRALDRLGMDIRVVIPLRHPGEVSRSIQARDRRGAWRGELQWASHLIAAETWSRRFPRIFTTFDDLLDDWRAVARRIARALGIEWPAMSDAGGMRRAEAAIGDFLSPLHRHFDVRRAALRLSAETVSGHMWDAALAGVAGHEAELRAGFASAPSLLALEIIRFLALSVEPEIDVLAACAGAGAPAIVLDGGRV